MPSNGTSLAASSHGAQDSSGSNSLLISSILALGAQELVVRLEEEPEAGVREGLGFETGSIYIISQRGAGMNFGKGGFQGGLGGLLVVV